MRYAAKVDDNHAEIKKTFLSLGCSVQDLAAVGAGCPDLLVGCSGTNLLVEVKDGAKKPSERKLRPRQVTWHDEWRGQVCKVECPDDAINLVNKTRRMLP